MFPNNRKVCCVCGDVGFFELLIYCSQCSHSSAHRYCLGIIPGSVDDTNKYYWVCENCNPSLETNPNAIVLIEDQPEPLQVLLPESFSEIFEEHIGNQCQHVEETVDDCHDEGFLSSRFVEMPDVISEGVILIVNSSGEITIRKNWNIPGLTRRLAYCAPVDDEAQNEDDIEHGFSNENNTVELDFGADEDMDSKTVELDFVTDEENDVEYHGEYPTIDDFIVHTATSSDPLLGSSDEIMEEQMPQTIKASEIEVPQHTIQPRLSDGESQSSISPEMSIPSSVLDMANELLENTLEKIDIIVGPYKISSDLAPILRDILSTYGDIFQGCTVEPDTFVVTVCKTIQHLQSTPFKNLRQRHVDFVRDALKVPKACGVDLKWLYKHCDYLQKIIHHTVQYPALKQEMKQTVRSDLLKKLEGRMNSIQSLWKRIYRKSLADGLF